MIEGKKVLALIPARGGSKGIINKNIIDLCGKPLIAYTIEAAVKSRYIDDVVVTTDSRRIAEVALEYGAQVPFLRPEALASDTSKTIDAVLHAISTLENQGKKYDILVLLQPTQPLRNEDDIDSSLELCVEKKGGVVSVSEVGDHPILIRQIDEDGILNKMLAVDSTVRRQDMPTYYRVNGCVYVNDISEVNEDLSFNDNRIPYVMPRERAVDIDEPVDLCVAAYYLGKN